MKLKIASPLAPAALSVVRTLHAAGFRALWAGGCVRDILMGREPRDIDIATDAPPSAVVKIFPRTVEVGRSFGVVQVIEDGHSFDVATFRRDASYPDGRHPQGVTFCGPEEDARRRDFTINGLFYDPIEDRILDFVNGQADIAARVIRAIGDPRERFGEDYLRMLRAVRFAATLQFTIEPRTAEAVRGLADRVTAISAERIQHEITRLLLEAPKAGAGVRQLMDLGLLQAVLPEVARMAGQPQPPEYHPEGDVFEHTVCMLDAMEQRDAVLAYAVLLHDVGKPPTARLSREKDGSERIRFDNHAEVGAELAGSILRRLRLSARDTEAVVHAVRGHMRFLDVRRMRTATLRRWVAEPTFPVEMELHRLDCTCSHGKLDNHEFLTGFVEQLRQEPRLPPPWITGKDLLALGLPEGPEIGRWHRKAFDAQLEGRFATKADLLKWVRDSLAEVHREP